MVNLNVWLAPDSANLGSAETNDGGGLTVFHAKPPSRFQPHTIHYKTGRSSIPTAMI
ncbi:unnamed protein product [Laminaria digitata]